MYSKSVLIAMCALAMFASCVSLPWKNAPAADEVNLAFTIEKNLLVIRSVRVNGRGGRFVFGSAEPRTVFDATFAQSVGARGATALDLGEKQSVRVTPAVANLHGTADAILGADAWGNHAVSIDYLKGLITYQAEGIHPEEMMLYRFTAEPKVNVIVDGRTIAAIVDTASPDTLVLPRGAEHAHRAKAKLSVAGTDFGTTDIAYGDVAAPRIGNRLLSKFLVTIDYGRHEVGLWRDPRIPL